MKKIAIISLFDFRNINYGNKLQTYALNYYLRTNYKNYQIESLYFRNLLEHKDKKLFAFIRSKIARIPAKINSIICSMTILRERLSRCNEFSTQNTRLSDYALTWDSLITSDYDAFVVGSDIVWAQFRNGISKIKFLDFETTKRFTRISYAASFGRDWIPEENTKDVTRCLKKFQCISVRESSTTKMLSSIGIDNAVHALDPTLLVSRDEWQNLERKPQLHLGKYIFVYLLGKDANDREYITRLGKNLNLNIVTVPYACGEFSFTDKNFGDLQVMDCSPAEWIWLIHNAEYVITDSFHGTVFSTIFEKKFLVVERQFVENINNRMIDYLNTIQQNDKMVKISQVKSFDKFIWNYENINKLLKEKIEFSKEFLEDALKNI